MAIFNTVYGYTSTKILYMPLEGDILDYSKNNITMTATGTVQYSTLSSGKKVLYGNPIMISSGTDFVSNYLSSNKFTVSYWVSVNKNSNNRRNQFCIGLQSGNAWYVGMTTKETGGSGYGYDRLYYYTSSVQESGSTSFDGWHYIAITYQNGSIVVYINGSQYTTATGNNPTSGKFAIGFNDNTPGDRLYGYMSEFIIDEKIWTADEITAYYNKTKSNYGL